MERKILTHIDNTPIYRRHVAPFRANKEFSVRAKALRKAGNLPEIIFWLQVKKGGFYNIDFDRQRVVGNYIVDFYVKSLGLVIEIDGSSHIGKEAYDKRRENYLVSVGLVVFRVSDTQVKHNMSGVFNELKTFIIEKFG